MHLRRARALVGLLTLQAGLVAYSGVRAARAFMEQSPASGEARVFAPAVVPLESTELPAPAPITTPQVSRFVLEEIVDPWQAGRAVKSNAEELVDPWRDAVASSSDTELLDPWRNDSSIASLDAPVAAFDWDTSPPELLNPWPAAIEPPGYDLIELIDPWSTVR